jgi:hypothetical protein
VVDSTGAADSFRFTESAGSTIFEVDYGGDGTQDLAVLIFGVTGLSVGDLWFI